MKWETNLQMVGVTVEEFVLVGEFFHEDFLLKHLPFMKWDRNVHMVQKNSQLMLLMELLINRKGSQHVQSSFHSIVGT